MKKLKTCNAIYRKGKFVDCYFSRAVAVRKVDDLLGQGLFSKKWEGNKKGDFEIVPCTVEYDRVFIVKSKKVHSVESPTIFPSINSVEDYLEQKGLKVNKHKLFAKTFVLSTDRGELKGDIVQVK